VFPVAKYFPLLLVKNKLKELFRGTGAIKKISNQFPSTSLGLYYVPLGLTSTQFS
jgi:hypothetical protein